MHSLEKIALTGATGFIGSRLVRALVAMGCQPVLLARSPRPDTHTDWRDGVRWVRMDLLDKDSIVDILLQERPTTLFHLAGTRGRDIAARAAVACAELNVWATVRLFEAAMRAGVRRLVTVGSADEYGHQPGPWHEGLRLRPTSPYGISKAVATHLAQALYATGNCPIVILRPFSVYGPGQPSDMFVADAVMCAVNGVPFRMSHGHQRRDLVFVDDVVQALIAAARTPAIEGRVINIGSGRAYPLRCVAKLIWQLSQTGAPLLIGARPATSHEVHDTWADISLAHRLLQWEPQTELASGVHATIQWARQPSSARRRACQAG